MAKTAPVERKVPKITLPTGPGKRVVVTIQEYKEKDYLMMREQYLNEETNDYAFGRNGFNIALSKLTPEKCESLSRFFAKLATKL
jgi:hypothetical protein